ncbi:hypothetical protein [Flavobacterium sp. MDT1-60]|uniref:hypothetical protein n=1 Tax=Flavobacterium sp. MDT1-60 TaxID=1979344 RepID=UPI00177C3A8D|nr:hypothetical protein [Flavobacterium sp. MDT1-60]QOG01179.1 hypothetical protein IHE43_15310 [Flavobacterium sp. MDT1-60]
MKKCTLILMVILTIAACKKEKEDNTTVATETNVDKPASTSDSLTLDDYYKLPNIEEKAKWLKQHGDRVKRKILEEAVLKDHKVKGTVTDQKGKYVITWGDLKKIIKNHGYDAYVNLEYKENKIDTLKMVYEYISTKGGPYYRFSTALIRSLAKEYAKKNDNAEFHFSFAIIDKSGERVVVIQVNGNPGNGQSVNETPYFDYSTDPSKKNQSPNRNIPL